jgi:hypothetical protein
MEKNPLAAALLRVPDLDERLRDTSADLAERLEALLHPAVVGETDWMRHMPANLHAAKKHQLTRALARVNRYRLQLLRIERPV